MADIELSRTHAATPEKLRDAVARLTEDADLYGLFSEWKGPDRLVLTGKGVTAVVDCGPGTVAVTVTLPWLFRLAKGVIRGEVESKLQAVVAQAET